MKIARLFLIVLVLLGSLAIVNHFWFAQGVVVDVASVTRGTLTETIQVDGLSQATDREIITAPTAGQLERMAWRSGDSIRYQSLLATIAAPPSSLLDPRSIKLAKSRVQAAESELRRAQLARDAIEVNLKQVQKRKANLSPPNSTSRPLLPDLDAEEQARKLEFDAAGHGVDRAQFELDAARSQLEDLATEPKSDDSTNATEDEKNADKSESRSPVADDQHVKLYSPIDGHVLRNLRTDAGIIAAGTPLLEIGNLERLEFVFEVVTNEAAQLEIGTSVQIEGWGNEDLIVEGRVSRIDRSASRRLSALGVEEHTVRVFVESTGKQPVPSSLGHDFHVEGKFLVRETTNTLKVPLGALFREDGQWYVFRIQQSVALKTPVEVGPRNDQEYSIISGLSDYDLVVLFPAERITHGQVVKLR